MCASKEDLSEWWNICQRVQLGMWNKPNHGCISSAMTRGCCCGCSRYSFSIELGGKCSLCAVAFPIVENPAVKLMESVDLIGGLTAIISDRIDVSSAQRYLISTVRGSNGNVPEWDAR